MVFVCGGKVGPGEKSLRNLFLDWAKTELPDFICILAEDALSDNFAGEGREFVNLSKFERIIADVSDCVLIFPESAGSYAEIGFFSHSDVRKKTFVANLHEHQTRESFINLGPIDSITTITYVKPVYLTAHDGGIDFMPIKERLESRVVMPEYRRRLHFAKFKELDYRQRIIVLFELLRMLQIADLNTLRFAMSECFESNLKAKEVKHLLRILLAASYIVRDREYFKAIPGVLLVDIEHFEFEKIVAQARYFYEKHVPDLYVALTGLPS
jgi:hypothetical protein